nr:MAG TPA: hypothetical protein [Crassvirales sp.]
MESSEKTCFNSKVGTYLIPTIASVIIQSLLPF